MPMRRGSTPAAGPGDHPGQRLPALGRPPVLVERSTAAAPSFSAEELPAVTVPPFGERRPQLGQLLGSCRRGGPRRGQRVALSPGGVTGISSASNAPAS